MDETGTYYTFRFAVQVPEKAVSVPDVPAGGDFRLGDVWEGDDRLVLTFTDTLSRNAALAGMIELEGVNRSYVKLDGRQALVYFDGRSDKMTLRVDSGVKDIRGHVLVNINLAYACLYSGLYDDCDALLSRVASLGEGQIQNIRLDLDAQERAGMKSEHIDAVRQLLAEAAAPAAENGRQKL